MLSRNINNPLTYIDGKFHRSAILLPKPPYLNNPIEPINIDLGRQLFVDDYFIESISPNIKRIYHQTTDITSKPLLMPIDGYDETRSNCPLPDAVLYDPIAKEFKMWYVPNYEYVPHRLAIATSKDGINWIRKNIKEMDEKYEFETKDPCCTKCSMYNAKMLKTVKNTSNLICSIGGCRNMLGRGSGNILMDLNEKDPNKRFKLAWGGFRNVMMYYSADGIHWNPSNKRGGWLGGSVWYLSYNPFRNKYVYTMRDNLPDKGRITRYIEVSHELDTWPKWDDGKGNGQKIYKEGYPVPFCMADNLDIHYTKRKAGIYAAVLVPYESIMVNLFSVYHSGDGFNKRCSLHAGFSRDGFHYTREHEGRKPIVSESGSKYYILATGGNICIVNEQIYIYYIYKHNNSMNTGVGSLRRDGFVSLKTVDNNEGIIITKYLNTTFQKNYLFINIKIEDDGYIKTEIIDENNKIISNYEASKSILYKIDTTKQLITWNKLDSIKLDVINKINKFKIKFYVKNADFYSFWISQSIHGESNGFIGHGGPNYNTYQDTISNYK